LELAFLGAGDVLTIADEAGTPPARDDRSVEFIKRTAHVAYP
jgi:hypothetical protein